MHVMPDEREVGRHAMTAWARRGAWGLVLLVLVSWLAASVLAAAGVAPTTGDGDPLPVGVRAPGGASSAPGGEKSGPGAEQAPEPHVVLVGIPGLTWEVIDPASTPVLARLARQGGTAALVLRGTHEVTCSADAWLTLGAGQRAATDVEGCRDADFEATPTSDRPTPVFVEEVVKDGAVDADVWDRWRRAADERALDTRLGTLAALAEEGGTCVAAYGGEAFFGAARPDGTAAFSVAGAEGAVATPVPGRAGAGSTTCRVHLVSTPPVSPPPGTPAPTPAPGQTVGAVPPVPAAEIDAAVAEIEAQLPAGTTLVVAGLGHTPPRAQAMALVVHPVGVEGGASLSSGSTRQTGLVQLTDLTPTLLRLAGVEPPVERPAALAGQSATVADGGPGHVKAARDLAAGVSLAKSSVVPVLGSLAVVVIPLLLVGAWLRRRWVVAGVATVAMAVPVATFLAGLVPWWRADAPVAVLTLVVGGLAVMVAAAGWAGPWRRLPLAPAAVVSAVTLVVLGADMLWSARLGLVSVLGLQPVTAGRFYGQGNVGFGIALGAFLVLAGTVLSWLAPAAHRGRASRPAATAVALLGAAFALVGTAPGGGADFGGVPAVVVATGLLVLAALALEWSVPRLLGLGLLGLVAAVTVMVLDWLRGPGSRTHLGDFVQRVIDGEALGVVTRKLDQSLGILVSYPLSWLAVLALVLVGLVVVRRPGWSAPLWRHHGMLPAFAAGLVAMALAWALNDSGIAVVALALTVLIAAALTVLGREIPARS